MNIMILDSFLIFCLEKILDFLLRCGIEKRGCWIFVEYVKKCLKGLTTGTLAGRGTLFKAYQACRIELSLLATGTDPVFRNASV